MKFQTKTLLVLTLASIVFEAVAKVSLQEATKLGNELTPIGAEKAGNKAGTIPAWTGGLAIDTSITQMDKLLANPFSQEQPIFTITSKNLDKYRANLSEGQIALFEKYPDTYSMPIYKTHRTAAFPQFVYDKAEKNAISATLVEGGNGVMNYDETVPFAIPQNGTEVIFNHITRYRGGKSKVVFSKLAVQPNGTYAEVTLSAEGTNPHYLEDGYDSEKDDNILFYYMQSVLAPARLTGNILLLHETIDQIKQPRSAWTYNAGQRRIRRAPQVAYDGPSEGSGGMATADQTDMFNGSPDKYNWELIGKKEMYIPYNSYEMGSTAHTYDAMIQPGHVQRDLTRYELHRVWEVKATLKEGERHIYGQRHFFVDEDSWQIAVADMYDNRGEIWRMSEMYATQFINPGAMGATASITYDFLSGGYLLNASNEVEEPYDFHYKASRSDYTTSALRRKGKR